VGRVKKRLVVLDTDRFDSLSFSVLHVFIYYYFRAIHSRLKDVVASFYHDDTKTRFNFNNYTFFIAILCLAKIECERVCERERERERVRGKRRGDMS